MKVYRRLNANHNRRRRGVTLVEMLVTLAVLLLIMALVVQIFQAATGSMNAAQVYQRLDDDLRRLDSTIRADLAGATARFTPPLDPKDNQGYFEYIENEYADDDGEDCDDSLRFTVKAPEGRPFTGRMWVNPARGLAADGSTYPQYFDSLNAVQLQNYLASQPITVTSEHAEIIYFLRNGNLYRRVLLVAPELQSKVVPSFSDSTGSNTNLGRFRSSGGAHLPTNAQQFTPPALGGLPVSWQGVNDLSARPASAGDPTLNNANNSIVLNTLGDLTDRHNRFASPRWSNDFLNLSGVVGPDGIPDDLDGDNLPDLYPTLYYNTSVNGALNSVTGTRVQIWFPGDIGIVSGTLSTKYLSLGFPYVFRGAYSWSQLLDSYSAGWVHAPAPVANAPSAYYQFDRDPVNYVKNLNHNPLDLGDNMSAPGRAGVTLQNNLQTYWGFPTWRETLSPNWNDPTFQVNQPGGPAFPNGLRPHASAEYSSGFIPASAPAALAADLLPPMTELWRGAFGAQLFNDGNGAATIFYSLGTATPAQVQLRNLWQNVSWEDDLILTNVRSFDVKAFDVALADYADLGWGDDPRVAGPATSVGAYASLGTNRMTTANPAPPYLFGNIDAYLTAANDGTPTYAAEVATGMTTYAFINGSAYDLLGQTMAHEGRMPPLVRDNRYDAQYGPGTYSGYATYTGNIGDDYPDTIRLRRVWDSWSTTYSKAPSVGVNRTTGFPVGPATGVPPAFPSYPPPYPAPLRGIQIQVRVTDPTDQRIKVMTIRQDFTEKL